MPESYPFQKELLENDLYIEEDDYTEFTVTKLRSFSFKKYLAKICGEDETYGFSRKFFRFFEVEGGCRSVRYHYPLLSDGVYETSVKYFAEDKKKPVFIDRKLTIVHQGVWEEYPFGQLSKEVILRCVDRLRRGTFDWDAEPALFAA